MADIESNSINNTIVFENNLAQNYVNITEELKNKADEILNTFNNEYDNFKNQYDNAETILEEAKANVESKFEDVCKNSLEEIKESENKAKEWSISSEVVEIDENGNYLYSAKNYAELSEECKNETLENKNTIENYVNQVENYVEQANQSAINAYESEVFCKKNSVGCYEYLYAYCAGFIQNPTATDCYYIKENYTTEYPQYDISVDVYKFKNNKLELFEGEVHHMQSNGVLIVGSDWQNFGGKGYKPEFNITNYIIGELSDKYNLATKDEIPDISCKQDVIADLDTIRAGAELGATALQSYTETDPVYMADKPNLALKSEIPDTSTFALKTEIPTVPTNVSVFTNDAGYLTQHQDISGKADKSTTLEGYGITDTYTKTEIDSIFSSNLGDIETLLSEV